MPNLFAYTMLIAWPLVAMVLFRALPLSKALIWTIIGGYLVLPSATVMKIPMVPPFDKLSIPILSATVLCVACERWDWRRQAAAPGIPTKSASGRTLIVALLLLLVVTPVLTVLNNSEPIVSGRSFLPGISLYDGASMISGTVITILPFILAWRYLSTREAHRQLLVAFAVAGLFYAVPTLFEVRMSPQLHTWIYGFFQHDFAQHMRADGFRPIVFLNHGLLVSIFFCLSVLAALTLRREAKRVRERGAALGWGLAALALLFVLFMTKSLGAFVIAIALGTVVAFFSQRLMVLAAALIALIILFYPMLRGAGFIPTEKIHEYAVAISEERAHSLKFRLDNEEALLAHANRKPVSGWGSWGRNQLYDAETGRMTSVTDGVWIILIGIYGWLGYTAHFGLLTFPILLYARRRREFGPSLITPGLTVLLAAVLLDLIPNDSLLPYVWLISGAITGFVLRRTVEAGDEAPLARARPGVGKRPLSGRWQPRGRNLDSAHAFAPSLR